MTRVAPVPPVTAAPGAPAPARGALMMLAACAVLTINDAGMKALVADHPTGQIVSLRAMLGLVMLGAVTAAMGRLDRLRPRGGRGTLILAGMLVFSLFMFPLSLQFIPLADAIMLAYLSPVFVAILSPFVLRESVGWRRWSAVVLGLVGAALVIRPGGGGLHPAVMIPLVVAATMAVRDLLTRRFIQGESALAIVALAHVGAAVAGLGTLGFGWRALGAADWALLAGCAALITLSQVLMIGAFRHAEAAVLSCLKYSSILWAAGLGWLFFAEVPDGADWIGAILIALSGIIITLRTTKHAGAAG